MARRLEAMSIDEIRRRYIDSDEPVSAQTLSRLLRDPRPGVRRLHDALKKRYERERTERQRLEAMRHFELCLWKSGVRDIAGVDEVGMGPLAGPVVAAAVMFPPETEIAGVDDSKRLDPETRTTLAGEIRVKASGIGIGMASVQEIDTLNIYHAGLLAMRRAVEALPRCPQHVLVDARTVPDGEPPTPSGWEVTTHGGRRGTGIDAIEWATRGAELGVGEILLNSMDFDGTKAGFDLKMLRAVRGAVSVPVIASGGAGAVEHFAPAVVAGADAVLAASVFHFGELTIGQVKAAMAAEGIVVR